MTYVSFVTRRCSCLAYLFKQILLEREPSSFNQNSQSNLIFLTDAALVGRGWDIGKQLSDPLADLPDVVLVDDLSSYGRALSTVLEQFQKQLEESNYEHSDIQNVRIQSYKQDNISIQVYAEKKQTNLLPTTYDLKMNSATVLPPYQWNELSNRLSELLRNVNIANAAFMASKGVDSVPSEVPG
jgi:hypothetical protein